MTGGPKATRMRRVLSVSDGPVEVGYVPVHSAPEVKDRPLVMLQTIKSDGWPGYRICFDAAEAKELLASLAWVLEVEAPAETFKDEVDGYTETVKAAYPTRSGSHDEYALAMSMVGSRQSKGELVALVNWLLVLIKRGEELPPRQPYTPGKSTGCCFCDHGQAWAGGRASDGGPDTRHDPSCPRRRNPLVDEGQYFTDCAECQRTGGPHGSSHCFFPSGGKT